MRTLINEYTDNALNLKVSALLHDIEDEAIVPFWKTLKMTGLTGQFELNITRKDVGVSIAYPATKIGGSDNVFRNIRIKFQDCPSSCYEGCLSLKGTSGAQPMPVAEIREKLIKVAGIGWFNPDDISTRKVPSFVAKPFQNVSDVLSPTITATSGGDIPSFTHTTRPSAGNLSKSAEEIALLLQEFAMKSDGGFITSDAIAQILAAYVYSTSGKKQCLRGYGPIIAIWVKMGVLEAASHSPKAKLYKITEKAIKEYGLILPAPKEMGIERAAEMDYAELVSILGAEKLSEMIVKARENAAKLIANRTEINALTEQQNALKIRIKALKKACKDEALTASVKLIEKVPKI